MLPIAISIGFLLFLIAFSSFLLKRKSIKTRKVDEESAAISDTLVKHDRFKKDSNAQIMGDLYTIIESEDELTISNDMPLRLAEDTSDSEDEELVVDGVYSI